MLFRRAYSPEKITVGYALLRSPHAQPDVALFDLRFSLVPQPIVEVAIDLVGSPFEFVRRHSPQELCAPVIFLHSAHEAFRQGFRTGFDELDQFEGEHKVPPDGNVFRGAGCMYCEPPPQAPMALCASQLGSAFGGRCAFSMQYPQSSAKCHLRVTLNTSNQRMLHTAAPAQTAKSVGRRTEKRNISRAKGKKITSPRNSTVPPTTHQSAGLENRSEPRIVAPQDRLVKISARFARTSVTNVRPRASSAARPL